MLLEQLFSQHALLERSDIPVLVHKNVQHLALSPEGPEVINKRSRIAE
jgi:hypothetical protein